MASASNYDARRAFAADLAGRSEREREQETQFLASFVVTPPAEQKRSAHHLGRIFAGSEWVTREVVVSRIQGIHEECRAWEARVGESYSAFSHECVWDIKTFMENDFDGAGERPDADVEDAVTSAQRHPRGAICAEAVTGYLIGRAMTGASVLFWDIYEEATGAFFEARGAPPAVRPSAGKASAASAGQKRRRGSRGAVKPTVEASHTLFPWPAFMCISQGAGSSAATGAGSAALCAILPSRQSQLCALKHLPCKEVLDAMAAGAGAGAADA
jgi:hypothetical protein